MLLNMHYSVFVQSMVTVKPTEDIEGVGKNKA